MDYPLALLHTKYNIKTANGSMFRTSYQFWRNMHNTGRIKSTRAGSFRMVSTDELDRLEREGIQFRGKPAKIVKTAKELSTLTN
jgi:hypothetical protein